MPSSARASRAADTLAVEAKLARVVADADGFRRFVVPLTVKGAPKGEYQLGLVFKDPKSGSETATSAPVRVE